MAIKYAYHKLIQPMLQACYDKLIKPIFQLNDSPESIAKGLAIGLFIALTPTVGIQMTLSIIICTLVRANRIIAIAMCWVSNPITFLPMYYGYYRLGLLVTNSAPKPWEEFKVMIQNDYVVVGPRNDPAHIHTPQRIHLQDAHTALERIAASKLPLVTPKDDNFRQETQTLMAQAHIGPHESWHYQADSMMAALSLAQAKGGYALIDRVTYLQQKKPHPDYCVHVSIDREPGFMQVCWAVLAIGFMEIGVPMWVGSLIIALVFSLPAYPLTLQAIRRFRSKIEKYKERHQTTIRRKPPNFGKNLQTRIRRRLKTSDSQPE